MINITQSVLAYIDEIHTDYAIMINGDWGSGKSFYVRNGLFAAVKEVHPKIRTVYVSLNGLQTVDEIYTKILVELLGGKEQARIGSGMLRTLLELDVEIPKIGVKVSTIAKAIKNTSLVVAQESGMRPDMIICFDDLERIDSKLNMESVLGYIHSNFIDRKHMKIVIITDESKILDPEHYRVIKEKIVGRTFLFKQDVPLTFDALVSSVSTESTFIDLVSQKRDFLLARFREFDLGNLRTILFILRLLARIAPKVHSLQDALQTKVIFFITIMSIEYRKGNLLETARDEIRDFGFGIFEELTESSYGATFYANYVKHHRDEYQYIDSLLGLVVSGHFDSSAFESEVRPLLPDSITPQLASLYELMDFRRLSNDEFLNTTASVLSFVQEGAYGPIEFLQACSFLLLLHAEELLQHNPETILREGMRLVLAQLTEFHVAQFEQIGRHSFQEVAQKWPAIREFISEISAAVQALAQKRSASSVKEIFEALLSGDRKPFGSLDTLYGEDVALFAASDEFVEMLRRAPNQGLGMFRYFLELRYTRYAGGVTVRGSEKQAYETLLKKLKRLPATKDLRGFILKEMVAELEKAIQLMCVVAHKQTTDD